MTMKGEQKFESFTDALESFTEEMLKSNTSERSLALRFSFVAGASVLDAILFQPGDNALDIMTKVLRLRNEIEVVLDRILTECDAVGIEVKTH